MLDPRTPKCKVGIQAGQYCYQSCGDENVKKKPFDQTELSVQQCSGIQDELKPFKFSGLS